MFRNYLKIALRNIIRQKGYSFINIAGLAVGMACCMLIYLYISHEVSYDAYHQDADRIYRIASSRQTTQNTDSFAGCGPAVTPVLRQNYPEVEAIARLTMSRPKVVRYGDRIFREDCLGYADPELFEVFTIPFLAGDPETALIRPNTAVIAAGIAEKYFGHQNPLGQPLQVGDAQYEITGVIEDIPSNSHLKKAGIIASWLTHEAEGREMFGDDFDEMMWDGAKLPAYVKLARGTDGREFERKISMLVHEYIGEELAEKGWTNRLFLQPLTDIHLYSHLIWEIDTPGNAIYVYIFLAIGIIILVIACVNFVNIATARSAGRAPEVAMRKVAGAERRQLWWQFIGETVLSAAVSLLLSLILVELALPTFNHLSGTAYAFGSVFQPGAVAAMLLLVLLAGVAAGSYPAAVLSSFAPVSILSGSAGLGGRGSGLRKVLVVGQFALAIVLIIGTMVVHRQLAYMTNQYLGFDKNQKLVLEFPSEAVMPDNYQAVKAAFQQIPAVGGATISSSVPGRWMYLWRHWPTGEQASNTRAVNCFQVDYDFFAQYDLEMIAGQPFDPNLSPGQSNRGYILNEAAVAAFGWQSPEEAMTRTLGSRRTPVKGVMKNFHFRGLQSPVEPLGIFLIGEDFRYLTLTVNTADLPQTISQVQGIFAGLFPDAPFDYFFLDDDFERQYEVERRLSTVFSGFTILGVLIACMGLFGLTAFVTERRTREIGIRKVLGASIAGIVRLLSWEFIKWVLLANLIAWPVAYFAMQKWLEGFAYRIEIGFLLYLGAGTLALFIALLTVGYQAVRASLANPVKAIRHE